MTSIGTLPQKGRQRQQVRFRTFEESLRASSEVVRGGEAVFGAGASRPCAWPPVATLRAARRIGARGVADLTRTPRRENGKSVTPWAAWIGVLARLVLSSLAVPFPYLPLGSAPLEQSNPVARPAPKPSGRPRGSLHHEFVIRMQVQPIDAAKPRVRSSPRRRSS